MVKGISKRVVVVRSPGNGMFEQAIFIVKGEGEASGCTADDIIKEACTAAETYSKKNRKKNFLSELPAPVFALFGAIGTAIVWAVTLLI
jgi:hypothetical protein